MIGERVRIPEPSRSVLALLVIGIPCLATISLLYLSFHATLSDFIPYQTDETHYWHEILTFSRYGFHGGYYTFQEHPAPAGFTHFGSHGPVFAILYGTIARLIGWQYYTGVMLNMIVATVGIGACIALTRLDRQRLLTLGVLLLTFWPMLLFMPVFYQEPLHQALAMILAGVFSRLHSDRDQTAHLRVLLFGFLVFSSLIRPTWSFLFVAYFLAVSKGKCIGDIGRSLVKGSVAICILFLIYAYDSAPFPYGIIGKLKQAAGYRVIASILFWNTLKNTGKVFWLTKGTLLEIVERYQVVLLIVVLCCLPAVILSRSRLRDRLLRLHSVEPGVSPLFHAVNLGIPLLFTVVFYDVYGWRDQRLLAPHLLLSVLMLIMSRQRVASVLIGVVIVSNILIVPGFLKYYRLYWSYSYQADRSGLLSLAATTSKLLIYRDNPNAWCNTLLWKSNADPWPYQVIAVPAGIGLSFSFDKDPLDLPLKSQYVLLDESNYSRLKNRLHLKLLGMTEFGGIYVNLDSHCGPSTELATRQSGPEARGRSRGPLKCASR